MAHNKRFATYRNALLRAFAVITFLTLASLATLPEVSRAQCPDATVPDPSINVPWTYSYQIENIGTNCTCEVAVSFCTRSVNGVRQVLFTGVYPMWDQSSPCNSMKAKDIITQAINKVPIDPCTGGFPLGYNPCEPGQSQTVVTQFQASCWGIQHGSNPINYTVQDYYGPCFNGTSWCQKTCSYCITASTDFQCYPCGEVAEENSCTYTTIYSGDCQGDPTEDPWLPEQCYNLNPCAGH